MNVHRAWAVLRGVALGVAGFALLAHVLLLLGRDVSRWWLPACALAGVGAGLSRRAGPPPDGEPAPRWLFWSALAVIVVCAVALGYGAVATPARAWDGIVAWELKARALAAAPSLDHPLFSDPAVWHHSADYPLLQPLCVASLSRWFGDAASRSWFPAVWLAFVLAGGLAVARAYGPRRGCWGAAALAAVPFFVNSSGGGADSGYAEITFAAALTVTAAALLLRDAVLLAAATFALPLIKPEGAVVAPIVAVTCFVLCDRRLWHAALAGAAVALALWLPLQQQLAYRPPAGPALPLGVLGLAAAAAAVRFALDRWRARPPLRAGLAVAAVLAALAVLVLAQPHLAESGSALLGGYLGGLERAAGKLGELPAILLGLLEYALMPRRFGLTFLLLAAVAVFALWRRRIAPEIAPLAGLLALGVLAVVAAFLLSPEPDVRHHLRSSAPRLLSHWVGVAWLAILAALGPAPSRARTAASHPPRRG